MRKPLIGLLSILLLVPIAAIPLIAGGPTNKAALEQLAQAIEKEMEKRRPQLYYDLLASTDPAQQRLNNDPSIQLMYINERGMPVYYQLNNLNAAQTISTDDVWPGGSSGHNLNGSATSTNQLAVWDGDGVLLTHQEFGGRVTQMDSPSGTHWHSTHVAGTMIASGVAGAAKGMSIAAQLSAYEWTNDTSEMATAAAGGLRVSNHSYGYAAGWTQSGSWYWFGDLSVSTVEDYGFGFYDSDVRLWDQIAYNAPNYLIVKSAGNDRNDFGPGAGGGHYHWNGGWVWATDNHDPDGGADMYDCVGWIGNAKNILAVGAINDIPGGYTAPGDVVQTSFSSWGPSDDGRVKPDIVANGAGLYSCSDAGNTSYTTASGTSMSSPNASGSINLLEDHYTAVKGGQARSATMKAIVIHTADEAGANDGPDYQNGWGLMNTTSAADIIAADAFGLPHIRETALADGVTDYYHFTLASPQDLRITVAWTDPPGTPPPPSLNPSTPMLVNDIDVRVEHVPSTTTYYPWVLDRLNPGNAASQSDNSVDNIEMVDITSAQPGLYRVAVSHKGSLTNSPQQYSIVCTEGLALGPSPIPTLTEWGLIGLVVLLVILGVFMIAGRRKTAVESG
ncbi:MAG: S8 family serine peptidase [Candidatus Latescibacteria bacterium]|nr:S8 family serine peptidase [Candidatus Latescibacterota bacterium]NIM64517.1 S8 family serine peptidase [Candidatus Latescibacterota bacterium]NIO00670.1 S8 family serine peptidase [Candidatus Latescibacterota bacterium]NIO27073.1 S8 family serine peptidase [Candidatus Latescibacterota bacterium]NIO54597.1 S8 family serine peptidase [Candidatus Latescibacterota bacterium]